MSTSGKLVLDSLIVGSDVALSCSFLAVFFNLRKTGSARGLSLQTLLILVSARCLHVASHQLGLHYRSMVLPEVLYLLLDLTNAVVGVLVFSAVVSSRGLFDSYEWEKDSFGRSAFQKLRALLPRSSAAAKEKDVVRSAAVAWAFPYVMVTCVALVWYLLRSAPQVSFLKNYFCCFYETMGFLALIPQLWMFQQDKRVSGVLANFVAMTALHRCCTLLFWLLFPYVFPGLFPSNRWNQIASESLNLLILSDFLFYYLRSKLRGESEVVLGDVGDFV